MKDQIQLINDAINKTKENLKESSFNFIFWGLLIAILTIISYLINANGYLKGYEEIGSAISIILSVLFFINYFRYKKGL